jgi:hypothetical protein
MSTTASPALDCLAALMGQLEPAKKRPRTGERPLTAMPQQLMPVPAQAATLPRTGLRCRLAIRSSIAADELRSMDSAHRTHLAAKWSHAALLSAERVNSAIARHSAANLLNFSVEFIEPSSLCRTLSYPTCALISAGGSLHPLEWLSRCPIIKAMPIYAAVPTTTGRAAEHR